MKFSDELANYYSGTKRRIRWRKIEQTSRTNFDFPTIFPSIEHMEFVQLR